MSVVIELRFPLGRFHARRWNQPPFGNGSVEWPPSPWRLLRAIAARWFQYCRETGDGDTARRDGLLHKLADTVPLFRLPIDSTVGPELRQYQPTDVKFTKVKSEPEMKRSLTTLMPDRCRAMPPDDTVLWVWNQTALSPEERDLLSNLLRRMHYFGRAESWTRLRLLDEHEPAPATNCELALKLSDRAFPVLVSESTVGLVERLLAPSGHSNASNRPIPSGTGWRYATLPVGSKIKRAVRCNQETRLQVARFAFDSTVLPLVTQTLLVAEAARRAIMSIHGRLTEQNGVRGRSSVFAGKSEDSTPLVGHRHAYYLPTDEDDDGRLDHLTVFAQEGFDSAERRALDEFRRLNSGRRNEEDHPLRLLLLGMGKIDELAGGPLRKSKVWVSATPYIATRHAKRRGRDAIDMASPEARAEFLMSDIRAQLATVRPDVASNGGSEVQIECEWDRSLVFRTAGGRRPIEFQRCRRKTGDDGGQRLAGAFRLTFDIALSGPVVIGWSSHFGMGLFVPVAGD